MPALHPGEMLREEFMKPLGLSANALAIALRVPVTRISEIVRERRGITADTALRLARYFNMTPQFWMRLQMDFDLESASEALKGTLREEIRPRPAGVDASGSARAIFGSSYSRGIRNRPLNCSECINRRGTAGSKL
jgi:addiction module HigA family antidote